MRRLDIGVEDRALVTVLGADPGWNALVAGALGVAGAVVDIAGPERWDDVVAALRRGELGAVVVLAPSLAAQARALARVEPDVARRVVCRDPGLTATAEWPPGALPVESTLDDLVVAALGAERVGPPVSVELELGRDAVRALLGAAAVLRPTLKLVHLGAGAATAVCLTDGLVRAAGAAGESLVANEELARDPSLAMLLQLWGDAPRASADEQLHAELELVCEYGDLFAASEAHGRHVTRVVRSLLADGGGHVVIEGHDPASRGADLAVVLRDACAALPAAALVPEGARARASAGLPPRLREAFPASRFGRLFFVLEEEAGVDDAIATARLPRDEALVALAVGALTGAVGLVLPRPPPPPLPLPEPVPTRPRLRQRERVATELATAGRAAAACGNALRFLDRLRRAAEQTRASGQRVRLRGTRFEPVGEVPRGDLVLGYHIGRGGMAEVLLGALRGADGGAKVVAVKRRRSAPGVEDERRAMFEAEARASVGLVHPNIVRTHELLILGADGEYLLVMEFVHGLSLAELRDRRGDERLPVPVVAWIGAEVARGLHHVHRRVSEDGTPSGLVHRDVAPPNVMLGLDGAVKLIDFGVAGALSGVHQSIDRSRRVGRPSYMAPEVLVGQPITASIDQYALGVTLYELLVGERPHGAGEDAVEATLSGRHRPLLAARPDLPPPFALAVERAMSVHVAERFRDCGALARALLAAIPGTLDPRLALADLVYGAASDVLPHEIEAVARLSRAATELFAAREQP